MIDYKLIQDSIDFYESKNFHRIESPWMVSEAVDGMTRPKHIPAFRVNNNKNLVASGEQSFLYLYLKGFLPKGQFQTVTPCFRFDDFDFLHSKYFIKNELIKTDKVNQAELLKIVDLSLEFYRKFLPSCYVKETELGYDIEIKGHELGSYGIRECEFLKWIYGTGCAEPRLSSLIKIYGVS